MQDDTGFGQMGCYGSPIKTPNVDQLAAELGRGFERYYGFLGGDTHQYYPELVYDNHSVEPEKTPAEGYHLTEDLVDKAISFIADSKQVAPNKPFFMYFCPGAQHAPHHVQRSGRISLERRKSVFEPNSLNQLKLTGLPCLVEPRLQWAVQAKEDVPTLAGNCLHPVGLMSLRRGRAEPDIHRCVGVHDDAFLLAADTGELLSVCSIDRV